MVEPIPNQTEQGTPVCDISTNRAGEYPGKAGPYAMLRPLGGGREWEAAPQTVRPTTPQERLIASVKAANSRSRAGNSVPHDTHTPECQTCTHLATLRTDARARNDGTTETDANVLLRRHRDHEVRQHRRVFRYVPYAIVQAPTVEPEYEARCVSGDDTDCDAESGRYGNPVDVKE